MLSGAASAREAREREWFGTVYYGKFIRSHLLDIPQNAAARNLRFRNAHFVSGSLSYVALPDIRTDIPGLRHVLNGSSIELEAQVGRYFGRQHHGELTFSALWRSPDMKLPGDARLNLAFGEGLSWATAKPKFEGVTTGQEPRRFLNYLALEAEMRHPSAPDVALVARVHHRSGVFGLIAPQGSGSNFLGMGVRVNLR